MPIVLIGVGIFLVILAVFVAVLRAQRIRAIQRSSVLIALDVPRENEKTPLAAEQLFSSLHGVYRNFWERLWYGRVFLSFELEARKDFLRFYVRVPALLEDFVTKQIYAQYPTVTIRKSEDYVNPYGKLQVEGESAMANLVLQKDAVYPIQTFPSFDVDPLASMTSALGGLTEREQIWVQMIVTPVDNGWQARAADFSERVRQGRAGLVGHVVWRFVREVFYIIFIGIPRVLVFNKSGDYPESAQEKKLSDADQKALKLIQDKATKLGFAVTMRIWATAETQAVAQQKVKDYVSALQAFTLTHLNGFKLGRRVFNVGGFKENFKRRRAKVSKLILNTEELASVYHLPNKSVETPGITWSRARKGEPPANLPVTGEDIDNDDLTIFGETDFRHEPRKFGIKQLDRLRHIYVIGKTGMGKSTLLANMAIDDVRSGRGVGVIDPHGDLIETVLDYVPKKRINDVVLFDPADREFPVALNMLESVSQEQKNLVASGLIAVFYKLYAQSWGPRLEHILRNTILALLDAPDSTLMSIPRMLVDPRYRETVVEKIENPTVAMFWKDEFPKIETSRSSAEALGAVQNKVGQFLSVPIVRNIVGQSRSSMDFRELMDDGRIVLVNLSKGRIGEDISSLLGSMLVTKLQLAAMSRADIPESERVAFHLYVDEFQNFATTSFASILSEARKYKLSLTLANQYIGQMPEDVRAAVFGNVGSLISFAVGATDAGYLEHELSPVFTSDDLTHLDKHHIYLRMTIDGINSEPFSASTLPLPVNRSENRDKILKVSRERYGKAVDKVESQIGQVAGFDRLQPPKKVGGSNQ